MIDPIAFSIGSFSIRWYGIAYVVGFILGAVVIYKVAKFKNIKIDIDELTSIMLWLIFGILIGGRLGYCLFYGNGYYFSHIQEIFAISNGGMSFHGAVIGALIFGFFACKSAKISYLQLADLVCTAAPLGIFFGRVANFINGELWGAPTSLPIGVIFDGAAGSIPRHPSQLYEAFLEGLVLFVIMITLAKRTKNYGDGFLCGSFFFFYGIFRFVVEFVRVPDVQIGYLFGGWLTLGMVLSVPLIILGILLMIKGRPKSKNLS